MAGRECQLGISPEGPVTVELWRAWSPELCSHPQGNNNHLRNNNVDGKQPLSTLSQAWAST